MRKPSNDALKELLADVNVKSVFDELVEDVSWWLLIACMWLLDAGRWVVGILERLTVVADKLVDNTVTMTLLVEDLLKATWLYLKRLRCLYKRHRPGGAVLDIGIYYREHPLDLLVWEEYPIVECATCKQAITPTRQDTHKWRLASHLLEERRARRIVC